MKKLLTHDTPLEACQTIISFLNKEPEGEEKDLNDFRESLFLDFCFRLQSVDTDKVELMLRSCNYLYDRYASYDYKDAVNKAIEDIKNSNLNRTSKPFDVGIITILGKEQRAVLRAFGANEKENPKQTPRKHPYWELALRNSLGKDVNIALTRVSKQRNVQCALAVQDLLQEYNPKIVLLIGVAAGPEPKVYPMDVVFGTQVYDYEGGRLEESGLKPRPQQLESHEKADAWFEVLDQPDTTCGVESLWG